LNEIFVRREKQADEHWEGLSTLAFAGAQVGGDGIVVPEPLTSKEGRLVNASQKESRRECDIKN
jgi:hypothetical protein